MSELDMEKKKIQAPEILWPAIRQYARSCDNILLPAFHYRETVKIVESLQDDMAKLEADKKDLQARLAELEASNSDFLNQAQLQEKRYISESESCQRLLDLNDRQIEDRNKLKLRVTEIESFLSDVRKTFGGIQDSHIKWIVDGCNNLLNK